MHILISKRKLIFFLLTSIFISLLLAGCKPAMQKQEEGPILYTVTDATGTELRFKEKPQRIVSLNISVDEVLLDLVEPKRIAALTSLADNAEISNISARSAAVKGRVQAANPESILALKPDLIILPNFTKADTIVHLREMQLPVYVYNAPYHIEGIKAFIHEMGVVVHEESRAQQILQAMEQRLQTVCRKVEQVSKAQQKRVVFMNALGAYYSPEHSFNDICQYAGVQNALAELKYTKPVMVAQEEIVRLNPDVFVLSGWTNSADEIPDQVAYMLRSDPGYSTVKAVQRQAIYILPARHLLSLSQYVVEAADDLARAVYGIE